MRARVEAARRWLQVDWKKLRAGRQSSSGLQWELLEGTFRCVAASGYARSRDMLLLRRHMDLF